MQKYKDSYTTIENQFKKYIKTNNIGSKKGLTDSSVDIYVRSLSYISSYLAERDLIQFTLYEIDNVDYLKKFIKIFLDDKNNIQKDETGNGRLRAAARNYIKFREELNTTENNETTSRSEIIINRPDRNKNNVDKIKNTYLDVCQVCGICLDKQDGNAISNAAHIRGLGEPHNGPDILENMLCLCPNHHALFDAFSFYIDPDNYTIRGFHSDLDGSKLSVKHKINKDFLLYHKEMYHKEEKRINEINDEIITS